MTDDGVKEGPPAAGLGCRIAAVRLIGITASLLLLPSLLLHGAATTPTTVRVLTYNIHHGEGRDGEVDLARLARVIAGAEPDLVALQEVDVGTTRTGGVNQLDELATLTGMHAQFGKAMDYMGGGYGVAVLSRWPLVAIDNEPLPSSPDREPRTELTVGVRLGDSGPRIQFTSTHLDQLRPEERLAQAEYLNELLIRDDMPGILAGDMNARPDAEVMKIFEPWWTMAVPSDPTAPAGVPFVTPPAASALAPAPAGAAGGAQAASGAGAPRRGVFRNDHVLFRPSTEWRPLESRFIDDTIASDHRPVMVVLELMGLR